MKLYSVSLVNPGTTPKIPLTYGQALKELEEASKKSFIGGYEMENVPVEGELTLEGVRDERVQELEDGIEKTENYKTRLGKYFFGGARLGLLTGGFYMVYSLLQLSNLESVNGTEAYSQGLPFLSEIFYNIANDLPILEKSHHYVDWLLDIPEIAEYYYDTYFHGYDFARDNLAEEIRIKSPLSYDKQFRLFMLPEESFFNVALSAITGATVGTATGVITKASNVLDKAFFLPKKKTKVKSLKNIKFKEPEE